MMTRRDFRAIAGAVWSARRAVDPSKHGAIQYVSNALAEALAQTNPAFDRARFLAACETGNERDKA